AACHAPARTPEQTAWPRITALYDALAQLTQSPVVEVNRAVAYTMAFGPAAGLEIADALQSEPALANYHLLPTVRGDFLAKLGRFAEARAEFDRAASLTRNARERTLLLERALLAQFHPLEEALTAMGVAVWPMTDLEADDALASAAAIASGDERVERVCIWTPDKDLAQCVRGDRVVQVDRKGRNIRNAA